MDTRRGWWWLVGILGLVVVVVAIGFVLRKPNRPEPTADPATVQRQELYPASPILSRALIKELETVVRARQRLSVVRFVTDAVPGSSTARGATDQRVSATRIGARSTADMNAGVLDINGTFSEVKDLQDGFKDLGHVKQGVRVNQGSGGDPAFQRLRLLLTAQPDKPLLLLAISVNRIPGILTARLLGPLQESDAKLLPKLVARLQQPEPAGSALEAEGLLESPNPWLVWLGLAQLKDRKALTSAHYRQVIESRPAAEVPQLFPELCDEAITNPKVRADLLPTLQSLLQLPDKQMPMFKHLSVEFVMNPVDRRRTVDIQQLGAWLVRYKRQLQAESSKKEVIAAVEELLHSL